MELTENEFHERVDKILDFCQVRKSDAHPNENKTVYVCPFGDHRLDKEYAKGDRSKMREHLHSVALESTRTFIKLAGRSFQ